MVRQLKWILSFILISATSFAADNISIETAQPVPAVNKAKLDKEVVTVRKSQLHLRLGYVGGQYSGTFEGEFEVFMALDLDYELFLSNDGSVIFRFIQALDDPDTVPFYTYAGAGYRYYWKSKGPITIQQGDGLFIESVPKLRYYSGIDLGVAQVLTKSFGPNVQSVSNMTDIGVNVGAIYQVSRDFGVEAHAGASLGYGFSSTPVNGRTQRLLLGGTYYF